MKKTIGVVYGGKSHEHEVSLKSVRTFLENVDYKLFDVIPFLISKTGSWTQYKKLFSPISSLEELIVDKENAMPNRDEIDVFFPIIHGEYGEDGRLQGFFEILGVPYVGCKVESSAVGMNKILAKEVASTIAGVSVVPYLIARKEQFRTDNQAILKMIEKELSYPVFVKPARAGSSIGISKAYNNVDLIQALNKAFDIDDYVLIEKFINAREIEVAVIGNEDVEVSQCGEITYESDFYDYENKYLTDTSTMHIPAFISNDDSSKIREAAKRIYVSMACSGYARVDFFIDKNNGNIYFNEINTSPGLTDKSMFPVLFNNKYPIKTLFSKIIALTS